MNADQEAKDASAQDSVHRIITGAPITRRELRYASILVLVWFTMDAVWFLLTVFGWL